MDMLAEAAALRDEGAAEILNLLRAQPAPRPPPHPPSEDEECSSGVTEHPEQYNYGSGESTHTLCGNVYTCI